MAIVFRGNRSDEAGDSAEGGGAIAEIWPKSARIKKNFPIFGFSGGIAALLPPSLQLCFCWHPIFGPIRLKGWEHFKIYIIKHLGIKGMRTGVSDKINEVTLR